jgi:hypothetical protein
MRFIAIRNNDNDVVVATMHCTSTEFKTQEGFFYRLRDAISEWVNNNEIGRTAWKDTNKDFNFGDLYQYSEEPSLIQVMAKHGIYQFKIDVVFSSEEALDYDTILVSPIHR